MGADQIMLSFLKEKLSEKQFQKILKEQDDNKIISFKESLNEVKKIIIIYPHEKKDEHQADNSLKPILDYFANVDLTIIKPNELHKEELSFSGFPKKTYFMKFNHEFDLLIDLNLREDRFSSYISANILAILKTRVYSDPNTDSVYHLSVSSTKSDLRKKVELLLQYFDRFKVSLI